MKEIIDDFILNKKKKNYYILENCYNIVSYKDILLSKACLYNILDLLIEFNPDKSHDEILDYIKMAGFTELKMWVNRMITDAIREFKEAEHKVRMLESMNNVFKKVFTSNELNKEEGKELFIEITKGEENINKGKRFIYSVRAMNKCKCEDKESI
jgi:hypothetical protein